ncbi:MAG: DUF1501 domain-containing protein [Rhodoferax sp.]|nr:DUF1501 domain-containing protein [Rhodoferax sp.]
MYLLKPELHSRRAFLRRTGQLAISGAALPMAMNLAAIGEAAAFNNPGDYKALVCVFLYGANDFANTVITYDNPSYAQYLNIRGAFTASGGLALPQSELAATLLNPTVAPVDSLGVTRQFALNPAMTRMANLFNTGKAAIQLNVGPLIVPLTRDQYNSTDRKTYPRPPQLFSHNDQQSIWQSSSPEGSKIGWGGNVGDLALASNTQSTFTCMSVTGNAVYLSGDQALQYQVTTNGAVKVNAADVTKSTYGSTAVTNAMRTLVQQARAHTLEKEYNKVTARSIAAEGAVTAGLATTTPTTFTFPSGNSLADQLKMVARLISARSTLGAQRQVFMVSLGGFDTHDFLARDHGGFRDANNAIIPGLVGKVSEAIGAFYDATVAMGIADKVTTFTASDFGRTLASNGDGSDHGWGSHHFAVGGAVKGQKLYGVAPPISVSDAKTGNAYNPENQWHVGQGRLLPTTSVDQFGATMAKWFGVASSEMTSVFPNIGNFSTTYSAGYMGFMA